MIIYLPIAFLKDWMCNALRKRRSGTGPSGVELPLKFVGKQKNLEMESLIPIARKDSEVDLSAHEEESPYLVKVGNESDQGHKENKEMTTREVVICAFYLAPIWFVTEVSLTIIHKCSLFYL